MSQIWAKNRQTSILTLSYLRYNIQVNCEYEKKVLYLHFLKFIVYNRTLKFKHFKKLNLLRTGQDGDALWMSPAPSRTLRP